MFARSRQRGAALLVLLAIWTTQLIPLLHHMGHRLDHVHGPRGQLHYFPEGSGAVPAAPRSHQHGKGPWHHHDEADAEPPSPHSEAKDPLPPAPGEHGAGSLEHFQAMWTSVFDVPRLILGACQLLQYLEPATQPTLWTREAVDAHRVRGPPRFGAHAA